MRWLEVRRHSLTKKGAARGRGSHLSGPGVTLARVVGAGLGPVAYVVTSASPRAIETAIAMGFAVDDALEFPSGYAPGEARHHDQWSWPRPYVSYATLIRRGGAVAAAAYAQQAVWAQAAGRLPDDAVALVVSHGGSIEPTLVACLPDADHGSWGAPLGHCEGARLGFDRGRWVSIEFRRVPGPDAPRRCGDASDSPC